METYSITHIGLKRAENQDRYMVRQFDPHTWLLAVADGMGGEAAGDQAAQSAIERLKSFQPLADDPLEEFIALFKQASRDILEKVRNNNRLTGMGTTLTAALVRDGTVYWAHVGDSRVYLFRDGELRRITWDHTLPDTLLKEGDISPEEARLHPAQNMLLQCIGCGRFKTSTGTFTLREGDLLLLTSDGLHHEIPETGMLPLLRTGDNLEKTLRGLVQAALDRGGRDNITVVGARWVPGGR